MFQPTKEWVINKVHLSSFELENDFKFVLAKKKKKKKKNCACIISTRKAKQLDTPTMFTYSDANTALGQPEHAYYLSYFIKHYGCSKRTVNPVHLP